ncbi:hypothetical protein C2G38_2213627 [Gigaspora rosea]|uniref:Uncharacterized protein n=1 Tax=Gigaspora rosea TaxID=44941 RepID=A0A397UFZ6_9GLOM|nr:hypothetical protein C2G38_2213627 [Gigaspora rosea]
MPTQKAEWAIERSFNTKQLPKQSAIRKEKMHKVDPHKQPYGNNMNSKKRIRASVSDLMQIEKAKPISKIPLHASLKINYIDKLIKDNETKNILEEVQSKLRKQKTAVFHLIPQQRKIEEETHSSPDIHSPNTPQEGEGFSHYDEKALRKHGQDSL